jgi:hypothetical protein
MYVDRYFLSSICFCSFDRVSRVLTRVVCAQLSVEVNGSLVGDSPYMVMFEVEDIRELPAEDEDGTAHTTKKVRNTCGVAASGVLGRRDAPRMGISHRIYCTNTWIGLA